MYKQALQIAYKAHKGQTRRDSNVPFIVHPVRVSGYFIHDIEKTIAVLHDVLEDTKITSIDLALQFPPSIIRVLDSLSRRKNETYFEYIERLSTDEIARDIKIADIIDNLSDCTSPEPQGMVDRYNKALNMLINLST